MKPFFLAVAAILLVSCTPSNPKFETNKAIAQKWIQAFETSNLDLWKEVVSEDIIDQSPLYGMGVVGYEASLQVAEFYINNYKNVRFEDAVWLPGVDTLSLQPDGSVRAYGKWTGESIATGRSFELMSYHNFDIKEGKIISTGEFFDATGMVQAVGPQQKNVVVATLHIPPGNFDKVQALMDSEDGLTLTRNYKGCTYLETTYNEESGMYFIIENWASSEAYSAYLNWRMTEDPSRIVEKIFPLLVGGEDGFHVYNPNTFYKMY